MWVLWAFGSALCAGLSSVLAKCGVKHTDSTLATALRTVVVLAMAWAVVFLAGRRRALRASLPPGGPFWCSPALPPARPGCATSGRCNWGM